MAIQVAPTSQVRKHMISLDEYERMIAADIFRDHFRLELIRGELIEMSPPGFEHEFTVARLSALLEKRVGDQALVWPQGNSIRLPNSESRPQPDATVLRWRNDYSSLKPPTSDDVLLVVEVSDTSLKYDKSDKLTLYAEAGIPEYWIVDLQNKTIESYSNPVGGTYTHVRQAGRGEVITLPGELAGEITVNEILEKGKPGRK